MGPKRRLQLALGRFPGMYRALLRLAGRGSAEKRAFLGLVGRGDVVLDIGANRGDYTVLFSDLVGPRGAVHAFEPVPATFARLSERVAADCGYRNVWLWNRAFGDRAGTVEMMVPGDDDGQASLRPHRVGSWGGPEAVRRVPVEVGRLDDWAAELPRLDFVKCDVEGAELPVMEGGAATLARLAPLLVLEVYAEWTRDFGYTPADLRRRLAAMGYDRQWLLGEPLVTPPAGEWREPVNLVAVAGATPARLVRRVERLRRR